MAQVAECVRKFNFGPKENVPKTTILSPIDFSPGDGLGQGGEYHLRFRQKAKRLILKEQLDRMRQPVVTLL